MHTLKKYEQILCVNIMKQLNYLVTALLDFLLLFVFYRVRLSEKNYEICNKKMSLENFFDLKAIIHYLHKFCHLNLTVMFVKSSDGEINFINLPLIFDLLNEHFFFFFPLDIYSIYLLQFGQ